MSDSEGYNGWKNYPTWAVNLWLTNDPGSEEWALDIVRAAVEDSEYPRLDAADELKYAILETYNLDEAGLPSDLLGYAFDCVDWYEIADAFIAMVEEGVTA